MQTIYFYRFPGAEIKSFISQMSNPRLRGAVPCCCHRSSFYKTGAGKRSSRPKGDTEPSFIFTNTFKDPLCARDCPGTGQSAVSRVSRQSGTKGWRTACGTKPAHEKHGSGKGGAEGEGSGASEKVVEKEPSGRGREQSPDWTQRACRTRAKAAGWTCVHFPRRARRPS